MVILHWKQAVSIENMCYKILLQNCNQARYDFMKGKKQGKQNISFSTLHH